MRNNEFLLFILALIIIGCESGNSDNPTCKITCVDFPEPPIEIMSNVDFNASQYDYELINYFNIVQVKDDLFYMYSSAYGTESGTADIDQGLFFANSKDAIHWTRKKPDGSSNLILENGIQEQYVFMLDSDYVYPFRLIANVKDNGKFKLCMWKSKNGYDFDFQDKKVLLEDRLHDTQNVMIPRKDVIYLYTRLWNDELTNRLNGIAKFDIDGNQISQIDTLKGNYLYNSAATFIDDKYDLLQPTYMNNRDGDKRSDLSYFKAFLNTKEGCEEIETNLNKWIKPDEYWRIVAPGCITMKGDKYIAYYTWTWSHDS